MKLVMIKSLFSFKKRKIRLFFMTSVLLLIGVFIGDCLYTIGWEKEIINSLGVDEQLKIAEEYGIVLNNDEKIDEFLFVPYITDKYYVIKIVGVNDVDAWCKRNSSWDAEKFNNKLMILDNKRYASQRIFIDSNCIYVSCLYENNPDIEEFFSKIYSE